MKKKRKKEKVFTDEEKEALDKVMKKLKKIHAFYKKHKG